jgi:hypothetical protein
VSVDVFDDEQLPRDFCVEKVTYQPNKNLIRKALEAWGDVPGARLVRNDRLTLQ